MYSVTFSPVAEKYFEKLQPFERERIIHFLERISVRPEQFGKKLSGYSWHTMRVGDYRLIVDIRDRELNILVIKIGHRKNVYDF